MKAAARTGWKPAVGEAGRPCSRAGVPARHSLPWSLMAGRDAALLIYSASPRERRDRLTNRDHHAYDLGRNPAPRFLPRGAMEVSCLKL